jgi:hypothetical protein
MRAVDPADSNEIALDYVRNAVPADAQTVVLACVEVFGGYRIVGQRPDGRTDRAHARLVSHIAAR